MDTIRKKYKKRQMWESRTERLLLEVWAEYVSELKGTRKNGHIFKQMSGEMEKRGCKMTISSTDIQTKIKNLTFKYRQEKLAIGSSKPSEWPLYDDVHRIVGTCKSNDIDIVEESIEEDEEHFAPTTPRLLKLNPDPSSYKPSVPVKKYRATMPTFTRAATPHTITSNRDETDGAASQADSDGQLFSTLCKIDKHNYLYLFERCKACNVNARQLRYLEKEHIRELVPKTQLGVWAEFEYLLFEWKLRNGYNSVESVHAAIVAQYESAAAASNGHSYSDGDSTVHRKSPRVTNAAVPIELSAVLSLPSNSPNATTTDAYYISEEMVTADLIGGEFNRHDEESRSSDLDSSVGGETPANATTQYTLNTITPTVLAHCQHKYKANCDLLTEEERSLLSSAIIEYFFSHKLHFTASTFNNIAEQIVQHFPNENKCAWYDRKSKKCTTSGRLYMSYQSKLKTDSVAQKRKANDDNFSASEYSFQEDDTPDVDEESQQIQNWLKCNKCEDMDEVINMWKESINYRAAQLSCIQPGCNETVHEVLENWPSYKWTLGHKLLNLDFQNMYPNSMATYKWRWHTFMRESDTLFGRELKDTACVDLFKQFGIKSSIINKDSLCCTIITLLHSITDPVKFSTTDSQHLMRLVAHSSEMDDFAEEYPCIFVVGDSLLNVDDCYVAYTNIRFKLKFADAFAVVMQLYILFKIDYPQPTINFWKFVSGYFFDIVLEHDICQSAVMEHILKYLITK